MGKWIFEISNEIETFEVRPMGRENKLKWNREDERLYDFKKSINDLVFIGEEYNKFLNYKKNNECVEQVLRIYQMCGLVRKLRFEGKFSMLSGKWNEDKCTVSFKIKENDKYFCTKRKKEYNIFEIVSPNEIAKLGAIITFDHYWCWNEGNPNATQVCDEDFITDNHWGFYKTYEVSNNVMYHYLRLVMYVPIGTTIPEWEYVTSDIVGKWKFVFEFIEDDHLDLFETLNGKIDHSTTQLFFVDQMDEMGNGFKLHTVLDTLLSKNCPDLYIVSDFFQWNSVNPSEINYVTGQISRINNLKLFQKSDVKRPNATNSATKAETNFFKLFTDVLKIFNCGYFINGNVLRIEHISWFEQSQNLDLVAIANDTNQTTLKGTRKYSYDSTKLPKYEYFEFMDESSEEFAGTPIWYNNSCVEDDDDLAETKSNRIESVTTDVLHCLTNSNSSSSEVTDSGFVIAACDGENKLIWLPNILETGTTPNNILAWTHLHRDFWKHGRVQIVGYMNVPVDEEEPEGTLFASTVSVKDQDPFKIQLCCGQIEEFNPLDFQNSTLGWGEVKSAELDMLTDMVTLEMMFKQ